MTSILAISHQFLKKNHTCTSPLGKENKTLWPQLSYFCTPLYDLHNRCKHPPPPTCDCYNGLPLQTFLSVHWTIVIFKGSVHTFEAEINSKVLDLLHRTLRKLISSFQKFRKPLLPKWKQKWMHAHYWILTFHFQNLTSERVLWISSSI